MKMSFQLRCCALSLLNKVEELWITRLALLVL